jgi:hypothetical protein
MTLALLINKSARLSSSSYRNISQRISLLYLLIASIIPDLDFVFSSIITHHTLTHSITFWSLAYIPLFLRWRLRTLPYFLATLSHLLGDFILGKPSFFFGISDQKYGLLYDYVTSSLTMDQFMLARALLDLGTVIFFLLLRNKVFPAQRMFTSDRDVFAGLPILIILVVSIFIASDFQDTPLLFEREYLPVFIATYSLLAIAHLIVALVIVGEARQFLKSKESQPLKRV